MPNNDQVKKLVKNISEVIVGKEEQIIKAVITLLAQGHLLIEDVPGVGKTTLAKAIAQSIDCGFSRIQFTPDTLPSDVTGMSIYNMKSGQFEFYKGAIMDHIVLADEINRTSPKTQASLLEAMEERQVTVEGKTYTLAEPFMVLATQNPIHYLGTYNLPEAQLDRFFMKISMGYPESVAEEQLVNHTLKQISIKMLQSVIDGPTICAMQKEVSGIKMHQELVTYIVTLVNETRRHEAIQLGASPRATLALVKAAQAKAYIESRDYVIPDDIIQMVEPVLSHRLILTSEAKMNKKVAHKVLGEIIGRTKVPNL